MGTYSIELAHLLMAASSEVDVVAKLSCKQIAPESNPHNIANYASTILSAEPNFTSLAVVVPRFGLTLKPWSLWTVTNPPLWWKAYNGVKHHRDIQFHDANLKNCLNAMAALFSITTYYYELCRRTPIMLGDGARIETPSPLESDHGRRSMAAWMQPKSELFRLRSLAGDLAERDEGSIITSEEGEGGEA